MNTEYEYEIIINEFEKLLQSESKLDGECIVLLKDTLASLYMEHGKYAKSLENDLEIKALLGKYEMSGKTTQEYLEKAEEHLNLIDLNQVDLNNGKLIRMDMEYAINYNYLNYLKGNVDEAIENFKNLMNSNDDTKVKKYVCQRLSEIFSNKGDYESAYEYSNEYLQLYNEESLLINKDYSDYSIQKYNDELHLREMNKKVLHDYIKKFIIILISIISIMILYMKNKSLKEENRIDGLTGIYNRAYLNDIYGKRIKSNKNFNVFIFDIDNFKSVNDKYGHLVGDEVLKGVAKSAQKTIGNSATLFRYGGEEFVVILDEKNKIKVRALAENIRKNIAELTWDNGMKITISMGVSYRDKDDNDPLKKADELLYISKKTGKNKVTYKDNVVIKDQVV